MDTKIYIKTRQSAPPASVVESFSRKKILTIFNEEAFSPSL
jgi:hypothetical protein